MDKAVIDNLVFRFHYRVTTAILFLCCILCTANGLIGDPISCINDGAIDAHVLNTYCWITSTFTLPHQQGKPVGTHVAHPGLGNYVEDEEETRYHAYYQWVPFMLFFQGLLFYTPHWFWKNWEEGKMRMISDGMRGVLTCQREDRKKTQSRLVQYMFDTLHMHNVYAFGYFFCEALNFVNVLGNIFFLDTFLGNAFLTYGSDVVRFSGRNQENRTDPMIAVFPRVTKCTFHKYGPSGTIQKHDAMCVLALNIINEKIFIFLWFWFIILATLSALALLYSLIIVVLPSTRETILKRRFKFSTPNGVSTLVEKTQVGDFLLIHLLGQNLNMVVFGEVLDEFTQKLSDYMHNNMPTAPSTLEMSPIYPSKDKFPKETEA